ncbi:MAG: Rpn family recombination-promoting nuclease/putative transposase [Lachnospiraceae bacterium]|nr:Rpn family recombination-promoting nuclease/putative transposase [Lachnospiraceae bacterium]
MKQIISLPHMDSQARDAKIMVSQTMDSKTSNFKTLDFHSATGKLEYTLTNDFLFKSLLQKNEKVLKALVASLMHLKMEEISSIEITNPIELGRTVKDKTFSLDIRLILNENTVINLEMQVLNKGDWPERSIGYLARNFDHLERGEDYSSTKTVIHIGFLNFDLPNIPPEFYSTYKLLNVKNNAKYSDKFTLSVVNLKHIHLATEEDKKYHIDKWAALFKAATWEEIKMIAGKDEYLNEAASELYKRLADLAVLEEYEARERYYRDQERLSRLEQETAEKDKTIDTLNDEIERLRELLAQNHISV